MAKSNDWLRSEIGTGLQKLLVLRLPGTPPAELLQATAEVWLEAMEDLPVEWDEAADAQRVRAGFIKLLRTIDRWPAPKHLFDQLGNRDPPKLLPAPTLTAAQKAENSKLMRSALAMLKTKVVKNQTEKDSHEHDSRRVQEGYEGPLDPAGRDQAD